MPRASATFLSVATLGFLACSIWEYAVCLVIIVSLPPQYIHAHCIALDSFQHINGNHIDDWSASWCLTYLPKNQLVEKSFVGLDFAFFLSAYN